MTRAATDERKGIQRLQNILVVLLLLVLAAVAARMVLVDEPQKWRQTELDIAVSRFIDSLWLARTEWMRRGKPKEVALLYENKAQQTNVVMNEQGWPSVEPGCLQLWQHLGSNVPGSALDTELENGNCHYRINQKPWFSYKSDRGQVVRK
ncbi:MULTISPECIES: Type II secretory pathway component [unclassified Idiomarina]|jgi:type II secretory pathway pseudopilin PulG|uniref:Type II secretory pathway component n=1 Tax=unclassified Idiomarina TaxID=2614829 RepID=UPI000C458F7F|nr:MULTISPECIES: Type II secretory pathway component [unclassified Idiomarina]MAA62271.1 Type II secretory pathway component [Idiomarina sp.]|tara:strand:+ start:39108 stop:39557 length:450 start_codon:yes stop_codon:yes gene_type:complete